MKKLEEYFNVRENIENRIKEIELFYEKHFSEPFVLNYQKGILKLKRLLKNEPQYINLINNKNDKEKDKNDILLNSNQSNNIISSQIKSFSSYNLFKKLNSQNNNNSNTNLNKNNTNNNNHIYLNITNNTNSNKIFNNLSQISFSPIDLNKNKNKNSKKNFENNNDNNDNNDKENNNFDLLNNNILNNKLLFNFQKKEKDIVRFEKKKQKKKKREKKQKHQKHPTNIANNNNLLKNYIDNRNKDKFNNNRNNEELIFDEKSNKYESSNLFSIYIIIIL